MCALVTGVQTCALPISGMVGSVRRARLPVLVHQRAAQAGDARRGVSHRLWSGPIYGRVLPRTRCPARRFRRANRPPYGSVANAADVHRRVVTDKDGGKPDDAHGNTRCSDTTLMEDDRKSSWDGKSVSVRVSIGVGRYNKKKK